jgi:hypothetical protein
MIERHPLFSLTAIIAAFALVWFGYFAQQNYRGICASKGRQLTTQEKRRAVIDYLNGESEAGRKAGGYRDYLLRSNHRYRTEKDFGAVLFVDPIPVEPRTNVDFYIYPDIPGYAYDTRHDYVSYKFAQDWVPVPLRYRLSGYAQDLSFLDLYLVGREKGGPDITERIDYRSWINACGDPVDLPDEYQSG